MTDLLFTPATTLRRLLIERKVSARELVAAHLDQIERVNPAVNAIVTLVPERAMAAAEAADEALLAGADPGLLHGLPVAHKDLTETAGIRTTYGSPLYADHVPQESALIVERMWEAGAIPLGKTNTPEFGAGSQTYNTVFGTTVNPYDPTKTVGGSSGGSAAALAAAMVALADGSDYGASLRNPAAFCNVVGFRPTPGRIPTWPTKYPWWSGSVQGPMGRTVDDVALLLSATAGPDRRIPISIAEPGTVFGSDLSADVRHFRVAWSDDLGGLPVDGAVEAVLAPHRETFVELGCAVVDDEPDLRGFEEAFMTWRCWKVASDYGTIVRRHPEAVKAETMWTAEQGFALTAEDLGRAEVARGKVFQRAAVFFGRYDFLVCPVVQVPPFDAAVPWVEEIAGVRMEHFLQWLQCCYAISVIESPAISMPAGFTDGGLPIGIQIVGRRGDDLGVLRLAKAFEAATGHWKQRPTMAVVR